MNGDKNIRSEMNSYSRKSAALALLMIMACAAADCKSGRIRRLIKSQKLVGVNLSGYDFYNLRLPEINLTRARLVRTSFTFCIMRNAILVNADLRLADLSAADLSRADLRGANLRGAKCHNTILRGSMLTDAYFYDADLSGADLRDAILADVMPVGNAAARQQGITYYAHFRNADFAGAAVSSRWKAFLKNQGVRNLKKIIWAK